MTFPLALVAVIAFVVLVVFLLVVLVQLRRTLQNIDDLVVNTNRELTPLLSNLRESSERIKTMVGELQHGMRRAEGLLEALGEVGDSVHAVNEALRGGVIRHLQQGAALWTGIKVFSRFFRKHRHEEGE